MNVFTETMPRLMELHGGSYTDTNNVSLRYSRTLLLLGQISAPWAVRPIPNRGKHCEP